MNRKKAIWVVLSFIIAVLSIWAVTTQMKEFSGEHFFDMITNADPVWLGASFLCMAGFIYFEGMALRCILKAFDSPVNRRQALTYSTADLYFSAITPSASGGQPASAFFMLKDGIKVTVVTVSLLINLVMYTIAILLLGVGCFLWKPEIFLHFSSISKILIGIGCVLLIGLLCLFILLLRHEQLVRSICEFCLRILEKLHVVRTSARLRAKLTKVLEEYHLCSNMITRKNKMLLKVLGFNLLQRLSFILVTAMAYLATGGSLKMADDIAVIQSFVILGSSAIPVPGAMGISDYLLLDAFSGLFDETYTVYLELLARGISFYSCTLISAGFMVISYLLLRKREKKRESQNTNNQ